MDRDDFAAWVDRYRVAWESNAPDDIRALFTEGAVYLTGPYDETWRGHDEIVKGWLDAKDEPGVTEFSYKVLGIDGDLGFVEGRTRYLDEPPREYANLWIMRLAGDGRAREYTEWWIRQPD